MEDKGMDDKKIWTSNKSIRDLQEEIKKIEKDIVYNGPKKIKNKREKLVDDKHEIVNLVDDDDSSLRFEFDEQPRDCITILYLRGHRYQ